MLDERYFSALVRHDLGRNHDAAFIVLTVAVVAWVLRAAGLGWQPRGEGNSALDILKDRFALGEIDQSEYEERKKLLSSP